MVARRASARPLLPGALALGCGLLLAGCGGQQASPSRPEQEPASPAAPIGRAHDTPGGGPGRAPGTDSGDEVETATLDHGARADLVFDSHLFVERDVAVLTRRAGIVRKLGAERGDRVRKDEVLCELENGDLKLAHEIAKIDADKARAAFDRARRLDGEAAISREAFENTEFALRAAERAAEMAAYELEKSFVRAPFDGIVSARSVEIGQVLAEEDTRVLFRVTAAGPLLARIHAPQWAYTRIRRGLIVGIHPSGAAAPAVEGRVAWVNDVLDPASGSVEILIEVPTEAGGALRPGMAVTAVLGVTLPPGRLTVSRRAVRMIPGSLSEAEVTVRAAAGAGTRRVRVGFLGDDRVEILAGLEAGDPVIPGAQSGPGPHGGAPAGP